MLKGQSTIEISSFSLPALNKPFEPWHNNKMRNQAEYSLNFILQAKKQFKKAHKYFIWTYTTHVN